MAVFGLDFGTTNSLVAYVEDNKAQALLDRHHLPHPSVVWYHGTECVVGRDAKEQLSERSVGVVGDIVRSPKRYLGTGESIHVAGRSFRSAEVVAEILGYLRRDALSRGLVGREFGRAVLTIPIHLTGQGRQELREAASAANIRVNQFVHEPLAALYGHLRPQPDFHRQLAALRDQVVLVFDWGGGTLDLTLCRFERGAVVQIQNLGNDLVGGDRFDERLVNYVKEKHAAAHGLKSWPGENEGARARLLEECELAKIDLSTRTKYTIFVRNCLRVEGPARDLHVEITRDELVAHTRDLVQDGAKTVDRLLTAAGQKDPAVAFCLASGGMVCMPYVREQLQQRFGLSRVRFAEHGDRIIAQGAAWIGYDQHRLCLAKPFEILDADNTYIPIIHAGQTLPGEGQEMQVPINFYCIDPRDGVAKLQFARPKQPTRMQPPDPRQVYTTLTLQVDPRAAPLVERLAVNLTIDENLVVDVSAESTACGNKVEATIHDLEFALKLEKTVKPGKEEKPKGGNSPNSPRTKPTVHLQNYSQPEGTALCGLVGARTVSRHEIKRGRITCPNCLAIHTRRERRPEAIARGNCIVRPVTNPIALRSNVTRNNSRKDLIPGEMIKWVSASTERQRQEFKYYLPCFICHRLLCEIQRDGCTDSRCPESAVPP